MVELEASSVYAVIASWLTPSYLFIFINLVIGTIALITHHHRRRVDSPGQLARSPSLLDRIISFNLRHHHGALQQPPEPDSADDPVRLDRAPSLLDRVKSFNEAEKQEDPIPNPDEPTRTELTRAPSLLERLSSIKLYRSKSRNEAEESEPEPDVPGYGSGEGQLVEEEEEEEEGVDKKADDFINRFKQQLKLQRLDSILRYRDMLKGRN